MSLVDLLDRVELFSVSQDIKDQLVLALADLITLVVSVATHFHKSMRGLASESVYIDIYGTFPGPIDNFRTRCQHVSELMWRHQLDREGLGGDKGILNRYYRGFRWASLTPDRSIEHQVNQALA